MAKKIQLQDANGNVLHPLTLGECVTMNNGENLDTLMSKSQMFTPTITQDKSMFKVGTGIEVDYSANVKDGAYESLMFKGKSLVNISQFEKLFEATPSVLNTNSVIWYGNTSKLYVNLSMFKPNTKYIVKIGNGTPSRFKGIYISGLNMSNPNGYYTEHNSVFTTPSTIPTEANMYIKGVEGEVITKAEYSKCQILILEYQDGMEDWDIPYFEGLCDSKMPILRNVGKNLFDVGKVINLAPNKIKLVDEGIEVINGVYDLTSALNINPDKQYTVGYNFERISGVGRALFAFKYEDESIQYINGSENGRLSTTSHKGKKIKRFELTYSDTGVTRLRKIQLEESSSETAYEDHKTNILRTSEEIVLREVNGVQDTYNPLTGEYVQRIGEIVITSTVSKGIAVLENNIRVNIAMPSLNAGNGTTKANNTLSDKFYWSEANAKDVEGLRVNGNTFHWCISKDKLTSQDLQGVNSWLQSNPITVQYELAEPMTTIIKPSTMTPFAYQNGHVIVESGHEGQSLLPEIEYSVVTGRTGQVTQNTKVLRKQEQQIIGLEELLLTQVVQMEYERTLLQFDYELQMMMLG